MNLALNSEKIEFSCNHLELRVEGAIGWLILNRPERRNALSAEMWAAIPEAIEIFTRNPEIRVIIVRGAGHEAFAAGADISEFGENRAGAAAAKEYENRNSAALAAIRDCPKPIIAMIHGFCIGGGLAIALSCDIRLASDDASFALPPAKLGLAYPFEGLRQVLAIIGIARAKEMIFTAKRLAAKQAHDIGLIHEVFEAENLAAKTHEIASIIAQNAPLSIIAAKAMLNALADDPAKLDRKQMEKLAADCFNSEDYAEGRNAFLEKRKAEFKGR